VAETFNDFFVNVAKYIGSIVIIGFATGFAIFKIYTEIPSLPVALLTLMLSICFSTNEVSIDSNLVMF
jgi:uncharacterized membrane protein (Fun14 family)